jgi:hypothetical protein
VKVKATILAVCFIAAVPAMASADDTVLLLHPGGFGFDDPSRMEMPAEAFESAGYRTVYLDYTLGDLPQAWRETKAAIRRYSVDYAYGESAGAVLAGLAGQRGLVDAAVMNSGLSNLTPRAADSWMRDALGLTDEQRALYSPGLRRSLAPVLTLASPEDLHYFRRSNLSWANPWGPHLRTGLGRGRGLPRHPRPRGALCRHPQAPHRRERPDRLEAKRNE